MDQKKDYLFFYASGKAKSAVLCDHRLVLRPIPFHTEFAFFKADLR